MIREPQGRANIFSNNGQNGLLGSSSTWENSEEAGYDSVSDFDTIIFLLTQHEIIGREITYDLEIFCPMVSVKQEYFASLIEWVFGICFVLSAVGLF